MKNHPYQHFIQKVEKPGRYMGGEFLAVKKDWDNTPVKIALAFPDLYEIGMSHLGMKILYSVLNKHEDILAERAYAPWFDMEEQLRQRELPIYSLESVKPLNEFDVIGVSLQYELTYTNVLSILDLSGLPLRAKDRDLSHPLVVAGGPCAVNPEPMAAFIDAFVIGDGEEIFAKMSRLYVEMREEGANKTDILIALSKLGGIYCPELYTTRHEDFTGFEVVDKPKFEGVPETIVRTMVENINDYPFPDDSPVPLTQVVFDRTAVEIARGCTEGCRFCQAGMIYRPVRERSPDQIIDAVVKGVQKAGYDESGLTSLSTADFSCVSPLVKELMKRLKKEKVSLSVSSLRAYGLSGDLLDEIADVRNTSLTFAPEAGTQRMRDVINKNISEEDIIKSAHNAFSRGWRKMKLYFMIGQPTETDEDVIGICETGNRIFDVAKQYYRRWKTINVTCSVSSFVPKPFTPFQWSAQNTLEEIQRKQAILKELTRKYRLGFKWHTAEVSHLEGVLARGDRKLCDVIESVWKQGARFDGWGNYFKLPLWLDTIEQHGIDKNIYLQTIPLDSQLPWGHIDVGVELKFLKQEYKRAIKDRLSPPCGKPFRAQVHHTNLEDALEEKKRLICYDCGVACDMTQMRQERIDYLQILGAEKRPAPIPDPVPGYIEKKPLQKFDQGTAYPYRAYFTKLERAIYSANSDLVRLIPRIVRRAGFPMYYTQGYHPKPVMSFAPALSLGTPSFGEIVDFKLTQDVNPEELLETLNQFCPEGVRFTKVEALGEKDIGLAKQFTDAIYLVGIEKETLSGLMDVDLEEIDTTLKTRIKGLLEAEELVVNRKRKQRVREVDIRPMMIDLEHANIEDYNRQLVALSWDSELVYLKMTLQIAGPDSVKPVEVLNALFGHDEFFYQSARLELGKFKVEQLLKA